MIGDKLIIEEHHRQRAAEICDLLSGLIEPGRKLSLSVAGESGAGKSELAYEIYRQLNERGIRAEVLQQDDYFVFPPQTNHEMRRRNLDQVGPYEVKLDFLDSNLRSFKRGESPIYKPLVIYTEDQDVLEREHEIISRHKALADLVISPDFDSIQRQKGV
jgi:uridine kinase